MDGLWVLEPRRRPGRPGPVRGSLHVRQLYRDVVLGDHRRCLWFPGPLPADAQPQLTVGFGRRLQHARTPLHPERGAADFSSILFTQILPHTNFVYVIFSP